MGDLDPHLIRGSTGPLESTSQNGISIDSAVLQGSRLWQTHRPTDRPCTR